MHHLARMHATVEQGTLSTERNMSRKTSYSCHVKSSENDQGVYYIGLTENTFKERWYQHKTKQASNTNTKPTALNYQNMFGAYREMI